MISQEDLKKILSYDRDTGVFKWSVKRNFSVNAGDIAGGVNSEGYVRLTISKKQYFAHRLAWLYETGSFPNSEIDHINGVRTDNRFFNLRECTVLENQRNKRTPKNNTSGVKGVTWDKSRNKWAARIKHFGVNIFVGYFTDLALAKNEVEVARKSLHGEFANNGDHSK